MIVAGCGCHIESTIFVIISIFRNGYKLHGPWLIRAGAVDSSNKMHISPPTLAVDYYPNLDFFRRYYGVPKYRDNN